MHETVRVGEGKVRGLGVELPEEDLGEGIGVGAGVGVGVDVGVTDARTFIMIMSLVWESSISKKWLPASAVGIVM